MKKHLKVIVALICVFMMASMFAACGGTVKPTQDTKAAETAAPETKAAATETAKKEIKGDLKYSFWGNPEQASAIQKQCNDFTAKNPAIKVTVDASDWGNYWTKLKTSTAAGDAPDVFAMSTTLYMAYYASKGALSDIGELAGNDNYDLTKFVPASLELSSYGGKLYGLPQDLNTIVMAYNVDMFKAAGVPAPTNDSTWDEILEAAKKLTIDKNGKNSTEAGFDRKNIKQYGIQNMGYYVDGILDPMAYSLGGSLFKDGKSNILDPNTQKAIKFFHDAIWTYHVAPDLDTAKAWDDMFITKQAAMIYMPSYLIYGYADPKKGVDVNFEVFMIPKGEKGGKSFNAVQSKGICIFKASKQQETAWEFVKFIASEDMYKTVVTEGRGLSPIMQQNKDLFLTASWGPKTTKQVYLDALQNPCPVPPVLKIGDGNTKIGDFMDATILRNKMPLDRALKQLDEEVNKAIAE